MSETPRRPVESRDPRSGAVWRQFPAASPDDVALAVAAARAAQPAWAALSPGRRLDALRRFHDILYSRRREIADLISRETGKPAVEALSAEVAVVLDDVRYLLGAVPKALAAPWTAAHSLALARKRVRVVPEPHGVVGVIAPWNYPFMLACSRILPAVATGNAVVFKPSELTPSVGEVTGQLLVEAGVPGDVIRVVQGDGATGAALTAAPLDKVFFTGSVRAGRAVATACAARLSPCELELGGNDAAIVCADADIGTAAAGLAWGRFSNAGQTCVAPKRIYVEAPAYEAFVAAVSRAVAQLRVGGDGDDVDVGPMIRPEFRAVLEAQRDDALARGASVVCVAPVSDTGRASGTPGASGAPGSSGAPEPAGAPGAPGAAGSAFPPTVLVNVPDDARAIREETFGPLMVIAAVRDADEAVERANASEFGLSASVWSRDAGRAGKLAMRLEAGTVAINDVLLTAGVSELPHGGVKHSGFGRAHGAQGIAACLRTRGVVADRLPGRRQDWWFGYSARHTDGVDAFLQVAHDPSPLRRALAWPRFLRFLLRPDRPLRP
ncbi:MAG: aldehyde dehydrogenase family protein [Gemmatimonadota bacterium]|nr:aldehyde dehydrogenase family protein [Gemmatimonadota bacterium]